MRTLIIVLLLFCVGTAYTSAQARPPKSPPTDFTPCAIPAGGCTEPWGALQSRTVILTCGGNTCPVTVWFKARIACVGGANFYDLSIGWVDAGATGWTCGGCMNATQVIQAVTQQLLQINPPLWGAGTGPNPDECRTTYRAQAGGCWVQGVYPFYDGASHIPESYWWVPCSGEVCCVRPWQVCNRFGAFIATPTGPGAASGTPECPAPPQPNGTCYSVCSG